MKQPWKRFESEVRQALELAGYSVKEDQLLAGAQTDLTAQRASGGISTRLVVECKFSEKKKPVSIDEVENFVARIVNLRSFDQIDHGYLVSNVGFTRNAHAAARHSFVELLTVSEIYRRIFDFSQYAKALTINFRESPLSQSFIHPSMARMSLSVLEDESGAISVSRAPSSEPIDMGNFCDQWLNEPRGGRLCFLGDYGAGKTSFCTWYANRQAERHLGDPSKERIPLLISLRRYTKAFDVKAMVTDILVNECGIDNLRLAAFEALLRRGMFLVLVDGFDEMARYVDREVRYRTISDLAWLGQGDSKLILTGRPSYFPSHEELVQVLGSPATSDVYEAARSALNELEEYTLYEVQPFSEDQICEFVQNYTSDVAKAAEIIKRIRTTYNLLDLASRPVLLDMIVKSLPRLIGSQEQVAINAGRLYDIYTSAWMDREYRKGEFRKLIGKENKLKFMEELAMQLFTEGKEAISHRQLGTPIREFFRIDDAEEMDFFSHDIRTCAFLRRSSGSDYEFIHRSFQEFFLAKKLISDSTRNLRSSWESSALPIEVLRFTSELLTGDKSAILDHLLSWAKDEPASTLGRNCLCVAALAGRSIPKETAMHYGMSPAILASAAAYKIDKPSEGRTFEEFVYLRAVTRVDAFLRREFGAHLIDSHDIVHEHFLSVMAVLRGGPLQTAAEIDRLIASTIRWVSIGKDNEKSKGEAVRSGYAHLLWGIRDPGFYMDRGTQDDDGGAHEDGGKHQGEQTYDVEQAPSNVNPEDLVLVNEIMGRMEITDSELATVIRRHYLEGETIDELSADLGMSYKRTKALVFEALVLAREISTRSRQSGSASQ